MKRLSAMRQMIIIGGTLFVLLAAWYAWWIRPRQVEVTHLQNQVQGVVRQVQAVTVQSVQIENLKKGNKKLAKELAQLEKRLFRRQQLPDILRRMVKLGERYNLRFSAVYPKYGELLQDVSSDGSPLLILPVEIQVDGEYIQFGRYVEKLDKQPYLFSIVKVEMAITRDSYPYVRVVLQGNLFLRRDGWSPHTG